MEGTKRTYSGFDELLVNTIEFLPFDETELVRQELGLSVLFVIDLRPVLKERNHIVVGICVFLVICSAG